MVEISRIHMTLSSLIVENEKTQSQVFLIGITTIESAISSEPLL